MKFTPRQYQLEGRDFLKSRKYALLGDAPGVGKTGQAILGIKPFWQVLIVCPASVKYQWQEALMDWAYRGSQVIRNSRDRIGRGEMLIDIVNYDLIIREPILKSALEMRFDLIIFDEAHKLKSMNAQRTKVCLGKNYLLPRADRIWFLTGTPVKNRPVDLFPILRSCAPEVLGEHNSYLKFVYRYCGAYQGQFGLNVLGASNIDELRENLKGFMLRREKRDVLDELPPRIVIKQDLECTPSVKKLIAEEEAQTIEAAGEDDPSLFKLGEVARIRRVLAKYKVPLCVEYINDLLETEEKIVVFYHHKEVLDELRRSFKETPNVYIDGSVDPSKRSGIVEIFAGSKDVRLFFGQLQACGEGVDGLQRVCSTCVFVEPSWSHTDIEQGIGRLERSGQRSDCNVHLLVIKDTIEARMMEVVKDKLRVDDLLYKPNKKERVMSEVSELKRIADALEKLVNHTCGANQPASNTKLHGVKAAVQVTKVEEVKPEPEEDVTEDVLRARAADVCALSPDGKAKADVVAVVKKICGGKIADLKDAKQRVKALAELDKLYDKYNVKSEEDDV